MARSKARIRCPSMHGKRKRSGVYGPRASTSEYLKAPITTLDSTKLPNAVDFRTSNRGRAIKQHQNNAWELSEKEFQLLELRGDAVLYDELPGILHKYYPNINVHCLTKLRQLLVTNNILSHLAVLLRLDVHFKVAGKSTPYPSSQKRLADMFEAYIGALWGETRDTMSELQPAIRANRRDSLEAWLAGIFSPKVFPDVGVDRHGKLFGVTEAWRQSALIKASKGLDKASKPGRRATCKTPHSLSSLAAEVRIIKNNWTLDEASSGDTVSDGDVSDQDESDDDEPEEGEGRELDNEFDDEDGPMWIYERGHGWIRKL